jgi:hypothetical protein
MVRAGLQRDALRQSFAELTAAGESHAKLQPSKASEVKRGKSGSHQSFAVLLAANRSLPANLVTASQDDGGWV